MKQRHSKIKSNENNSCIIINDTISEPQVTPVTIEGSSFPITDINKKMENNNYSKFHSISDNLINLNSKFHSLTKILSSNNKKSVLDKHLIIHDKENKNKENTPNSSHKKSMNEINNDKNLLLKLKNYNLKFSINNNYRHVIEDSSKIVDNIKTINFFNKSLNNLINNNNNNNQIFKKLPIDEKILNSKYIHIY